jgi:calcineurin-like phosphoesterase family protein
MKQLLKILIVTAIVISSTIQLRSQNSNTFKTDVETVKKPWTNLDFYNNPDNFQFAIVGDRAGGCRPGVFADAIQKLNTLYPEFVLSVGDLIQGYTRDTAQLRFEREEVEKIIDDLKMPFFYLPGNHDITNELMAKEWEERYGERYYNFLYKNTLFIILDSNDDDDYNLTEEQTDFVLNTLKENEDVRWTFVLMHHPIWTYDTGGRFEKIEEAMSNRKHTVIAGHTHHYKHEVRHNTNYYVLSTTGGGNALRGNRFGEFDHVSWLTMTDDGPVMANLRLDGILSDDVANPETVKLGRSLLSNTSFKRVFLCNEGDSFSDGTVYLQVANTADKVLSIDLRFYHHHQLNISTPEINIELNPGDKKVVEIAVSSDTPIDYDDLEMLHMAWSMKYDIPEYPDFKLDGDYNIMVAPTTTASLSPSIPQFLGGTVVKCNSGYEQLNVFYTTDGTTPDVKSPELNGDININNSTTISLKYFNERGQCSALETKSYEKIEMQKAVRKKKAKDGLEYSYFEGEWQSIPDMSGLKPLKTGVTEDFLVGDISLREDNYAILMKGYIKVPEDGMYVFRTRADDAGKFFIHDKLVINEDLPKRRGEYVGAVALKKGFHPVEIHFLERKGGQRFRVYSRMIDEIDWNFVELKGTFFH